MRTLSSSLFIVLVVSACSRHQVPAEVSPPSRYAPGQVWTYNHRFGDESSRVLILRVDEGTRLGRIIHAQVYGFPAKYVDGRHVVSMVAHMAFEEQAMDRSVREYVETTAVPEFSEIYNSWREAFDDGDIGAFSATVAEALSN